MDTCDSFEFSLTGQFHECKNCGRDRRLHTKNNNAPNDTLTFVGVNKPVPMPEQNVEIGGEVVKEPLATLSVKDRVRMMNGGK